MEKYDDAHPDMNEDELNSHLQSSSYPPTDKVSTIEMFKVPDTQQLTYGTFTESFERYKVKVDIIKWIIGTVGLTLITFIINWGFKDREQGMDEIFQYDKYATKLVVFSNNPVNKRMLAQFLSKVTPSGRLRKGWIAYYNEVDIEYKDFLKKDSLDNKRYVELSKKDTLNLSKGEKIEMNYLAVALDKNEKIKNTPIVIPDNFLKSTQILYIQSITTSRSDAENIKTLLMDAGFSVPAIEYMNKDIYSLKTNQIRYYRDSEYASAIEIQTILESQNIESKIQYMPKLSSKTKMGTIELWLK